MIRSQGQKNTGSSRFYILIAHISFSFLFHECMKYFNDVSLGSAAHFVKYSISLGTSTRRDYRVIGLSRNEAHTSSPPHSSLRTRITVLVYPRSRTHCTCVRGLRAARRGNSEFSRPTEPSAFPSARRYPRLRGPLVEHRIRLEGGGALARRFIPEECHGKI